ncbi:hypothetical protein [Spirulina major]|uniref:hypothetical protein n=1 Tax=Spirulina major TaxID=270636 RepID=UPI001114FCF5|nr:hypothetical protein [Spirulina major]
MALDTNPLNLGPIETRERSPSVTLSLGQEQRETPTLGTINALAQSCPQWMSYIVITSQIYADGKI